MTKPREKTREELQAEIEDGKKKIRQWDTVQSESALTDRKFSRRSSVQFTVQAITERSPLCSR